MFDNSIAYAKRTAPVSRSFVAFLALFPLWWLLLYVFYRFPGIDLLVARSVFTATPCASATLPDKVCGTFALARNPLFEIVRDVTLALPYIAAVTLIATLISSWRKHGTHWRTPKTDRYVAALISLSIGCGFIVNTLLKSYSGRPRPRSTDLFGGSHDFVQAGSFAGRCLGNCSFISGEASSGGWLLCLILLLPPRLRLRLGIPLAIVSIMMPVMRVMTGAHYLSDAVLGWLLSLVVFAAAMAVIDFLRSARSTQS
ncbi:MULTISPECIES: phosphatase PAP2 family protein [unclassified Rhizobium]|uniref:phosphatase PAP2 family protein n=1 Tax=unclassified Rhizobium TaxID=2613769 RepID=UPI000EA95715|nr:MULTISPECIES: phosphatase PAP2 family protein [unclassified Rhizobium]AYG66992.1 phosphatase PAP2 family protein [Rhizobium sp. CCGE531]AYG73371.1 phosphatase PAP2 family protein [Rhizobium sp. CCGE532]